MVQDPADLGLFKGPISWVFGFVFGGVGVCRCRCFCKGDHSLVHLSLSSLVHLTFLSLVHFLDS